MLMLPAVAPLKPCVAEYVPSEDTTLKKPRFAPFVRTASVGVLLAVSVAVQPVKLPASKLPLFNRLLCVLTGRSAKVGA